GHGHPEIVTAVSEQIARLNTNTRYVYDIVGRYAEALTATLPDELDTCYFVSSGSEANDLAWRLATCWTGNRGGLVLNHAYHGITEATYALSPAEYGIENGGFPHVSGFFYPQLYQLWPDCGYVRCLWFCGFLSPDASLISTWLIPAPDDDPAY
ncbi:MAG: aminotransferase class III-fold pyridoxal phosphate-dependent enzyme, partial [Candidatus Puniceispirillum sp.]